MNPIDRPKRGRIVSGSAVKLAQASISEATRRAYAGCLERLGEWLNGRDLTDSTLATYLGELFAEGKAPATAAQVVAAVAFRTQHRDDSIVGQQTRRVLAGFRRQAINRGRGQAEGLRWKEADKVAEVAEHAGLAGLRDAAIVSIASDAMLRISEIAALQGWRRDGRARWNRTVADSVQQNRSGRRGIGSVPRAPDGPPAGVMGADCTDSRGFPVPPYRAGRSYSRGRADRPFNSPHYPASLEGSGIQTRGQRP